MVQLVRAVGQVWHVGTHFSFPFSIYSENHGVQAVPLNFARSSDITYVHMNTFLKSSAKMVLSI